MYKIYSRPRIRIPKFKLPEKNDRNFNKKKKVLKLIFIFVIAFSTVKIILHPKSWHLPVTPWSHQCFLQHHNT